MNELDEGTRIVVIWLLYAGLTIPVFAGLFVWALRAGQFRNQDRARSLALVEPMPEPSARQATALAAAWVPVALLVSVLVMMVVAVVLGYGGAEGVAPRAGS